MSSAAFPYCDAAGADRQDPQPLPPHASWVMVCTILASGLSFVDGSVVNVALPAIARSLGADASALQWVVNAYLLPLSALLLLGGAAGDRFGRRRLLILGTALFALASLACTLAPGIATLLVSRLVQGVGAAILMPNSLAILGQTFSGPSKGRSIGIWAASGAAMTAIGPVLGGWLIDLGSWRAIFLINLPLALGAIVLAWRFVPRDPARCNTSLDWLGATLVTAGLGLLTWTLTLGAGRTGWTQGAVLAAILSAGLLVGFLLVERKRGDAALVPLRLFASKSFAGLSILTVLLYGATGGLFILLPYTLISVAGYSGTAAGAALLPLPLILAITSPFVGALAGRIGSRPLLCVGPLLVAAGFLMAFRIDASAHYWTCVLPMMLVIALGMSTAVAPLTTAVLTSVDALHTGSASALNSAAARTGSLFATALLGSTLAAGPQLLGAFHLAMIACAATSLAASFTAFAFIER